MEQKNQKDILVLIARFLEGLADSKEILELDKWINGSDLNRRYFEQIRNIWNESDRKINPLLIDTDRALGKVLLKVSKPNAMKVIWIYWQRFAAVLLLPLAIGAILWVYFNYQRFEYSENIVYNEVYAPFGTRSSLRLSDSTLVWLNSGSKLKYPDKFKSKNREVFLYGEAYFEVNTDISHPFIVNTSKIRVKATGTKFNVNDYESGSVAEVTLVSGKVSVCEFIKSKSSSILNMNPGQYLKLDMETGNKTILDDDVYKFIAWKDGKLIFRNDPISEVIKKIAIVYNVDIHVQGIELQNYRFRATFEDESLDEILVLLKLTSPMDYKVLERKVLPDGTYAKKEIQIFPSKYIQRK